MITFFTDTGIGVDVVGHLQLEANLFDRSWDDESNKTGTC